MSCKKKHEFVSAFDALDYVSLETFAVNRCKLCGLMMTDVGENPVQNQAYYPNDYYGDESRYSKPLAFLLDALIRLRMLILGSLRPGSALDVGCGQGWFLKHFVSRDWQVKGVEVSAQAAHHAKQVLGLEVLIGEKSTQVLEANQFDLIVLWHVLEHAADREFLLSEVHRLLKEDGQILLGVPNAGSLEAKLAKDSWFHLDVPRHIIHFNRASLSELLDLEGFVISKVSYFVPEYDFFSFVQSVQNKMGLPMNLLYRMIRRDSLSQMPLLKESKISLVVVLLTLPILFLASMLWVPLAAALKQGSSMTMVLTKKDAKQ